MELKGLLPCSQECTSGPYPEPDGSTPPPPILYLTSILILHPIYARSNPLPLVV